MTIIIAYLLLILGVLSTDKNIAIGDHCVICLENFNRRLWSLSLQKPIVLHTSYGIQHELCETCLSTLMKGNIIKCPSCRFKLNDQQRNQLKRDLEKKIFSYQPLVKAIGYLTEITKSFCRECVSCLCNTFFDSINGLGDIFLSFLTFIRIYISQIYTKTDERLADIIWWLYGGWLDCKTCVSQILPKTEECLADILIWLYVGSISCWCNTLFFFANSDSNHFFTLTLIRIDKFIFSKNMLHLVNFITPFYQTYSYGINLYTCVPLGILLKTDYIKPRRKAKSIIWSKKLSDYIIEYQPKTKSILSSEQLLILSSVLTFINLFLLLVAGENTSNYVNLGQVLRFILILIPMFI